MVRWRAREQIGGPDDVVDLDEAHFFLRQYNRGRRLKRHIWAFGIISRLIIITKKMYIEQIPDKTRETLNEIMRAQLAPGSYIMSDFLRSYRNVDRRLQMRGHARVNHSVWFVNGGVHIDTNPILGVRGWNGQTAVKVHTNNIERIRGSLKNAIRTYSTEDQMAWYIWEFLYRQNILRSIEGRAAQFRRFLVDIARVYPGPGRNGINHNQ